LTKVRSAIGFFTITDNKITTFCSVYTQYYFILSVSLAARQKIKPHFSLQTTLRLDSFVQVQDHTTYLKGLLQTDNRVRDDEGRRVGG